LFRPTASLIDSVMVMLAGGVLRAHNGGSCGKRWWWSGALSTAVELYGRLRFDLPLKLNLTLVLARRDCASF
jgi:hypothetical protein